MGQHYQRIELGDKVYFPKGRDRSPEYNAIFPETAKGLSVLDLGCNTGYYPLRAAYEGASKVVAVDKNQRLISRGRAISEELSLPVTFIRSDLLEFEWTDEPFDVTLCLNVLHYFHSIDDVDKFLRKMYSYTKKLMALVIHYPESGVDYLYSKGKRNQPRTAISMGHIKNLFPDAEIDITPSRMRPHDRNLVLIRR